jgi:hypothetical protein
MIIYSIVCTLIIIIDLIIIAINTYRIDEIKRQQRRDLDRITHLREDIRLLNQTLNLMADDLTTDYHSKEWVIQHYISEVRNGSRRSDKTM